MSNGFDQIPKDYKTFAELAEYARKRAKHSAARNGHQEFAYWVGVMSWAKSCVRGNEDPMIHFEQCHWELETCARAIGDMAELHAMAVHLRQMLINRGEKPPRLSLKWLREAASKL